MSIVTFLFTDIEGSTRRWEADPDAMRVALETHNSVLREAVETNDGRVFNYTGDGMCAVFDSPRAAVDAAVTAQRALELPVRMGIATGEAELRGGDYFGTVLNRTARVMSAGHTGARSCSTVRRPVWWHAHYFAGCEADVLARWDSPRQREAYAWFTIELANLRAAFRWAADHNDLDTAAAIAFFAAFLGFWLEQFEPVVWTEELIEPARAVGHHRLAQLYAMATQCYAAGRLDDSFGYAEAGLLAIDSGRFDPVPYAFESWMGGPYIWAGALEKWLDLCRNMIARGRGTHCFTQANLAIALTFTGSVDDALAASENLVATADATDNPAVICYALVAYGYPRRDTDPAAAYEGFRRGLTVARDSGNRQLESHLAGNASFVAGFHGNPADAFDYLTTAIRNHYDSGSFSLMLTPLAVLATVLDRLEHYEPAATISGFAGTPFTRASFPEMHILINHMREVLGDDAYESLAGAGVNTTNAAMAAYALDQIDRARRDLANGEESS